MKRRCTTVKRRRDIDRALAAQLDDIDRAYRRIHALLDRIEEIDDELDEIEGKDAA